MKLPAIALCLLLALSASPCSLAQKNANKVRPQWSPIDVTGEVVDSWCYASKSVGDGRGADHEVCAKACVHGGVTIGIVDDAGKMYIASKYKAYSGCQQLLEPYVAKRVHIKGMLATIGGCPLLKILSVEEVKPGSKAASANANGQQDKYHVQSNKQAAAAPTKPVAQAANAKPHDVK